MSRFKPACRLINPPTIASTIRRSISSSAAPASFSPIVRPPIVTNNVFSSSLDSIGNTSLIRLRHVSDLSGCEIYGKAEWQNPGGSVKDRAALWIIKDAEEKGILCPGSGVIVEGTAGNTGIGLTLVGNSRGYKTIICIAETQSKEKKDTLRQCGALCLEVPAVPFSNGSNYVHVAQRLAHLLGPHVLYANQWDNLANRRAHFESTGPEIWAQTKGKIDAFSCATGTGGTLSGVGLFLKSKNPNIKIALTDPCGAVLVKFFNEGKMEAAGDSISEGIGQGRITGNMRGFRPDMAIEISDKEALPILNDLLEHEGLPLGGSAGINVAGALRVAKLLGPGHTIVTILCDLGSRYSQKLYNPTFLRGRGLPIPPWLDDQVKPSLDVDLVRDKLKQALVVPQDFKAVLK